MGEILDELLRNASAILAVVPPFLVALSAFRRAILSRSRNFSGYAAVAFVAGGVCQMNAMFLSAVPVSMLVISGGATVLIWLEVRHRADARRKVRSQGQGVGLRTCY